MVTSIELRSALGENYLGNSALPVAKELGIAASSIYRWQAQMIETTRKSNTLIFDDSHEQELLRSANKRLSKTVRDSAVRPRARVI